MKFAGITFVSFSILLACQSSAPAREPSRYVRGQKLISRAMPPIVVEVARPFRYEGRFPFRIGEIAAGERLVFVDADKNVVRRLFVAQFERFLPESREIYRYDFSNAMTIGDHRFRHNVGTYSTTELRRENPGNEASRMHDFLTARGYVVEDELMMSRFVTLGSEDRRSELILFYIENVRDTGRDIASLEQVWTEVALGLRERSLAAFRIVG